MSEASPPSLRIVQPKEISKIWDKMQVGLERIRQRSGYTDWRTEDMYHSIKSGGSIALIDPNEWRGFLICSRLETFRGSVLWIWAAYGEPHAPIDWYWSALDEFAREEEIDYLNFSSDRRGWAKAAQHYGCRAISIVYEKQVK